MNSPSRPAVGIFTLIALLVGMGTIAIYVQVFVRSDQYPVFTSQDQIDAAQQSTFGIFSRHP